MRRELATLRFNLDRVTRDVEHYLKETPAIIARAGVDALLINEIALTGPTVAQLLGLPYFILSTSVPHQFGWKSSSWLTGYRFSATAVSWLRAGSSKSLPFACAGRSVVHLTGFAEARGWGPLAELFRNIPALRTSVSCLSALIFRARDIRAISTTPAPG